MAHIWSCPPGEGDDYIFHMHPPDQKIPKEKRLIDWYVNMLRKALIELIVADYKDILKDSIENNLVSPSEIPYFDGDFWPNTLEDILKEYEEEVERRRMEDENSNTGDNDIVSDYAVVDYDKRGKKKAKKRKEKRTSSSVPNKRKKAINGNLDGATELCRKVYDVMEKVKHLLFVIRLIPSPEVATFSETKDPDPLIQSDLMESRDAFLQLCREKNLEFSSLRRAKYSTMVMLYEIHNERRQSFMYNCSECAEQMETRYHCNECEEYDICAKCKLTKSHPHDLVMIGFCLDDDENERNEQEAVKSKRVGIDNCIKALLHACQCRDANCRINNCLRMKRIVQHTKSCNKKAQGICETCKQLIALCYYHAKICKEYKCYIPFCHSIKYRLKQKKVQQQFQQNQSVRRRCNAMLNTDNDTPRYTGTYPQIGAPHTEIVSIPSNINAICPQTNNNTNINNNADTSSSNAAYNAASLAQKHASLQKMQSSSLISTVTSPIVNCSESKPSPIQNNLQNQLIQRQSMTNTALKSIVNGNGNTPSKEEIQKVHQIIADIKRNFPQDQQNLQFKLWLEKYPQYKATFHYIRNRKTQTVQQQHMQQQHMQQLQGSQNIGRVPSVMNNQSAAVTTINNNSQLRVGMASNQPLLNQQTNRSSTTNNPIIVQQAQPRHVAIAVTPQLRQISNSTAQQYQMRICQTPQNISSNNNSIYSPNLNNNFPLSGTQSFLRINSMKGPPQQQQQSATNQLNYLSSRQVVSQPNLISINSQPSVNVKKQPVVAQMISGGCQPTTTFIVPHQGGGGPSNQLAVLPGGSVVGAPQVTQHNIIINHSQHNQHNLATAGRVIMTVVPPHSSSSHSRPDTNNTKGFL